VHDNWLGVERGPVSEVCDLSAQSQAIRLRNGSDWHLLIASKPEVNQTRSSVTLPAESVAVFGPVGTIK